MSRKSEFRYSAVSRTIISLLIAVLVLLASLMLLSDALIKHYPDLVTWVKESGILISIGTSLLVAVILTITIELAISKSASDDIRRTIFNPESIEFYTPRSQGIPIIKSAIKLLRPDNVEKDDTIADAITSVARYHATLTGDPIVSDWRFDYILCEPEDNLGSLKDDFFRS